ncbi:MAG: hypothetical protein A2511_02725 [Deltaproteobacteria bacterium RIFOXYD12_FULL_50_9]|nr:MAG: hypothetical protein A2511_02725 [Deltaproteobacteria bacterium RIFOXYD12_FULL_50_9]
MIKLTGIIVPTDWDANGTPVDFAISTSDEMVYLLRRQKELKVSIRSLLQREVEIQGIFKEEAGKKIFYVKHHRLIKRNKNFNSDNLYSTN